MDGQCDYKTMKGAGVVELGPGVSQSDLIDGHQAYIDLNKTHKTTAVGRVFVGPIIIDYL